MSRKNSHQVLVAGAGPAGLAAALFLKQRGLEVEVIDERWAAPDDDFHVILHPDVVERLDDAGARLDLAHQAHAVDAVVVHDHGRRVARLRLEETAVQPGPAAVLPLRVVRDALEAALKVRHVRVERHRRLARVSHISDRVTAEIDVLDRDSAGYAVSHMESSVVRTSRLEPAYLIAADGLESVVRQQLRIGWRALGPPMLTAAFEFESRWSPGPEVHVYVGNAVVTLWPGPAGLLRLTLELPEPVPLVESWLTASRVPDRGALLMMIKTHVPWLDLPIGEVRWAHAQRFAPGAAERTCLGSAWLIGEAAHQLSPLASHALNHGVRMAHDLATAIDEVERDQGAGERMAHQAARSYTQTLRLAQVGELFRATGATEPFIAANVHRIVPTLPAHGLQLEAMVRALDLEPRSL